MDMGKFSSPMSPLPRREHTLPSPLRGRRPYIIVACLALLLIVGIYQHVGDTRSDMRDLGGYSQQYTSGSGSSTSRSRINANGNTNANPNTNTNSGLFGGWFGNARPYSVPDRTPGRPIMGSMTNETLRAELGRAAWKLLHTMTIKFPVEPTADEQDLMLDYIYSFARLYPCGECARHFRKVLEDHPPAVSDRDTLAQWGCTVHNVVNKRLEKPEYDCSKLQQDYQCGCAEEEG